MSPLIPLIQNFQFNPEKHGKAKDIEVLTCLSLDPFQLPFKTSVEKIEVSMTMDGKTENFMDLADAFNLEFINVLLHIEEKLVKLGLRKPDIFPVVMIDERSIQNSTLHDGTEWSMVQLPLSRIPFGVTTEQTPTGFKFYFHVTIHLIKIVAVCQKSTSV